MTIGPPQSGQPPQKMHARNQTPGSTPRSPACWGTVGNTPTPPDLLHSSGQVTAACRHLMWYFWNCPRLGTPQLCQQWAGHSRLSAPLKGVPRIPCGWQAGDRKPVTPVYGCGKLARRPAATAHSRAANSLFLNPLAQDPSPLKGPFALGEGLGWLDLPTDF